MVTIKKKKKSNLIFWKKSNLKSIPNFENDLEHSEHSYNTGRNTDRQNHFWKLLVVFNNTEHLLNLWSRNAILDIYPTDMSINVYQKTSILKSIAASFRIIKNRGGVRGHQ